MATGKKFSFGSNFSADAKKKEAGVVGYVGETPPPGSYVFKLKRIFMDKDNGGDKIAFLAEIDDPREKYKEYAGYPVWGGQHLKDQAAGYLNQMLIAFGSEKLRDALYDSGGEILTKVEETKQGKKIYHVRKIGGVTIDPTKQDIYFVGVCTDNSYKKNGKTIVKLQISSYVPISETKLADQVSTKKNDDDEEFIEEGDDELTDTDYPDDEEGDEDEAVEADDDEDDEDEDDEDDLFDD